MNSKEPLLENESKHIRCVNAVTMTCCVYNMRTVLVVCSTFWSIFDAGDFTCLLRYTHYRLIRTTFIRTKYWTFHNLRAISTWFRKVKAKKMKIVSILIRNFESLYLTHNIIDFETTKLDFSYLFFLNCH